MNVNNNETVAAFGQSRRNLDMRRKSRPSRYGLRKRSNSVGHECCCEWLFKFSPSAVYAYIRCSGVVTATDDCVKIEKRNIMKNHMLAFLLCRSSDPPSVGASRVTFRVRRSAVPLFLFLAALCPRYYLQAALCSCMSVGYQIRSRVGCREVAWHDAQRSWGIYKTIVRSISSPHLCKEKSMILLESARRWFETPFFTKVSFKIA